MILAVTGTQQGATGPQLAAAEGFIARVTNSVEAFHHGCCQGVDAQLAEQRAAERERVEELIQTLGEFTLRDLHAKPPLHYSISYQRLATMLAQFWRDDLVEKRDNDGVWRRGNPFLKPPRTHVTRYRWKGRP